MLKDKRYTLLLWLLACPWLTVGSLLVQASDEEAKRHAAERAAQNLHDEMLSPRRLDPVRMAEERLALCVAERDEMRFRLEDELRRSENKLREAESKCEHLTAEARRAEDDHAAKALALHGEVRAAEERTREAELAANSAEQAKHGAMLEARGNDAKRAEISSVIDAQRHENEGLRKRLSDVEAVRHEEALKAETKHRELQADMRSVESAAKDEIRRLDQELHAAQQAQKAAEQLAHMDATKTQQELSLRTQQAERERDEQRQVHAAEVRRLADELRAANEHIERLNREVNATVG